MKSNTKKSNAKIWIDSIAFALLILALGPRTASAQQWSVDPNNSNNIYYNAGKVGIGTTSPANKLDVAGTTQTHDLNLNSGNYSGSISWGNYGYHVWYMAGADFSSSVRFKTWDGSSYSDKVTFQNNGNVGIGTTSPGFLLDAQTNSSNNATIAISSTLGSPPANVGFVTSVDSSNRGRYDFFWNSGYGGLAIRNGSNAAGNILFLTNNSGTNGLGNETEKVRIDKAGNVGIGTPGPATKLHVAGGDISVDADHGIRKAGDNWIIGYWSALPGVAIGSGSTTDQVVINSGGSERVRILTNGNVGIGTTSPQARLDVNGSTNVTGNLNVGTGPGTGNINLTGTINAKYQDVAEWVPSSEQISSGTVVVLDSTKSNQVIPSTQAYDTRVAGVVSEQPGLALGESGANKVLVATTGRVLVKVDATNGPIHIGDLLVTSDIPGVAMKLEPIKVGGRLMHMPGTLIGKALEPLEKGKGKILVLLSLQ